MWVESLRLLPGVAREHRVAFSNGLSCGLVLSAALATAVGFYLAGNLPGICDSVMPRLLCASRSLGLMRNAASNCSTC